jgi:hypothetical protein
MALEDQLKLKDAKHFKKLLLLQINIEREFVINLNERNDNDVDDFLFGWTSLSLSLPHRWTRKKIVSFELLICHLISRLITIEKKK